MVRGDLVAIWPIRALEVKGVRGGYSGVWKAILHLIFGSDWNIAEGIAMPDGLGGRFTAKSTLVGFCQDEKAQKELKASKGAGGVSCCQSCKNIYAGDPEKVAGNDYIKHYAYAFPGSFDIHTDETMWEVADGLSSKVAPIYVCVCCPAG